MIVQIVDGLSENPHLGKSESTINVIGKMIDYADSHECLDIIESFVDEMKSRNIF
ncbi:MAG: hypothetical protein ACRDD8_16320 [Bacteroidales bacterium]